MARFQRGSLRKEARAKGSTWVLRYYVTIEFGKRVERTTAIGLVANLPTEGDAWGEVNCLRLHDTINQPDSDLRGKPITFGDLARHYIQHELGDQTDSAKPKAHTTINGYRRNLANHIMPAWEKHIAANVRTIDVERWLMQIRREKKLSYPTVDRLRRIMSLVYTNAQRHQIYPRGDDHNPLWKVHCKTQSDYEAIHISPYEAFAIWRELPILEGTLTLLCAATGLRISEALGLKWSDCAFDRKLIHIRRSWSAGKMGPPKTAASKATVPMHSVLAEHLQNWRKETPYSSEDDFVFPSFRCKGKKPRVANMLVEDYLRPAAIRAGVISKDDDVRFGFHTLRHSLASFLVDAGKDPALVKQLLRHANITTTLGVYAHSTSENRLAAQGELLNAFFAQSNIPEGHKAQEYSSAG